MTGPHCACIVSRLCLWCYWCIVQFVPACILRLCPVVWSRYIFPASRASNHHHLLLFSITIRPISCERRYAHRTRIDSVHVPTPVIRSTFELIRISFVYPSLSTSSPWGDPLILALNPSVLKKNLMYQTVREVRVGGCACEHTVTSCQTLTQPLSHPQTPPSLRLLLCPSHLP
jgi:hypothetical protein